MFEYMLIWRAAPLAETSVIRVTVSILFVQQVLQRVRRRRALIARKSIGPSKLHSLAAWSVDFLSAVFLALVVALIQVSPTPVVGLCWGSAEALFFLWATTVRLPRLDALGTGASTACSQLATKAEELFNRLLDEREGALHLLQRYPHHLTNWFVGGLQHGSLGKANLVELLDHLLLQGQAKHVLKGCDEADESFLVQLASSLSQQLGLDFQEHAAQQQQHQQAATVEQPQPQGPPRRRARVARVPKATVPKPMAAHQEPLMACYRPLLFYVLMEIVAACAHLTLTLRMGFKCVSASPTASYYVKQGTTNASEPPIVFLHGIGVGLAPYLAFLSRLAARTGRTIVAVQYKHVSMRLTHHVPSAQQVASDVDDFLERHGMQQASLLAHSYGTLVASALLKRNPSMVSSLTLLDPVCFAMFLPHLVRNALYFHVTGQNGQQSPASVGDSVAEPSSKAAAVKKGWTLRSLMKGVVVRDVHVAAALSRNSYWADVNLWPTDLPENAPTTVVLSASDHLVPVEELISLLSNGTAAERGVQLQVHPERGHGAFVLDPGMQDSIIQSLGGMSAAEHAAITAATATASGAKKGLPEAAAVAHAAFVARLTMLPLEQLSRSAAALQAAARRLQDCMFNEEVIAAVMRRLVPRNRRETAPRRAFSPVASPRGSSPERREYVTPAGIRRFPSQEFTAHAPILGAASISTPSHSIAVQEEPAVVSVAAASQRRGLFRRGGVNRPIARGRTQAPARAPRQPPRIGPVRILRACRNLWVLRGVGFVANSSARRLVKGARALLRVVPPRMPGRVPVRL